MFGFDLRFVYYGKLIQLKLLHNSPAYQNSHFNLLKFISDSDNALKNRDLSWHSVR